jgi:hypothetical protein
MKLTLRKGNTLVTALLLLVLMFSFMPAPQPVLAQSTCDWAQFVADVSIPDGTNFTAGAAFTKTWRLKNIGTCTWSTSYTLVFVDGTQMGAPASVSLPNSVAPGNTVDVSVSMTAPSANGLYRGNWQLKNASAAMFGIGVYANRSFWVEIRVGGGSSGGTTGYDFVANASAATWTSGAGNLAFPGSDGDNNGFALKVDAPVLENGSTDTAPGLITEPQNVYGGYIQGQYPAFTVQSGDRFQSIINCAYNATSCYVNFRLNYQIGSGPVLTYWTFNERYEGLFYRANIDLSPLAGQDVKFILFVGSAGYATGDRALWGAPRITRGGAVSPTPTPGGAATITPQTSSCDRATFVTDVNVPDGTVFAPNSAFTKTWRIKNTGSCTWTTSYTLVFVSGNKMSGPDAVNLTSTVGPNTSFDLSVNLTAPATAGAYRGYWQLKNASGQIFGIGYYGDKPWWVDIAVNSSAASSTPAVTAVIVTVTPGGAATSTPTVTPTATPSSGGSTVAFDFTANPGAAVWTSGAGTLTFPGTDPDNNGFVQKVTSIKMEDSSTETRPTLLTVPQNITDGIIKGAFPAVAIQSGDHFQATIGCQFGSNDCYVKYWLDYQIGSSTVVNLVNYTERYEGLTRNIDVPLPAALAGQSVKFILTIGASNGTAGAVDRAVWIAPRITR